MFLKGKDHPNWKGGISFYKEYKNLRLSNNILKNDKSAKLFVDVKNTGKISGEEVVQLYVRGNIFETIGAIETLKGFERISLRPNQTKTVVFNVDEKTLQEYYEGKGFVVEKGEHVLMVGSSSKDQNMKEIKLIID